MRLLALALLVLPLAARATTLALPPTGSPTATVELAFRAGSVDDPEARAGLTALAAELVVRGGTRALPGEALERALYPLGASLEVHADREQVVFTASAPRAAISRVAGWLAEELLHPQLDGDALEAARQEQVVSISRDLRGDPEALAREALVQVLFPRHPYRHPVQGSVAGLGAITLDDVRAQLARVVARDRLLIGVAGGYPRELPTQLEAALAALPEHGAPLAALPKPAVGPRVLIVERPGASTAMFLGLPVDARRGDPDWAALAVGVSALGEHRQFGGRLVTELRLQRGLNYGAYAYAERFVQEGESTHPALHVALRQQYFSLWVRPVEHRNALFALRASVRTVEQLVRRGVGDDELARTRAFLLGATRLWAQTDARELGWAVDGAFYGDPDFLAHHREALAHVTAGEVDAALRRHLDVRALRMVIVTSDARALARALVAGAPTPPAYPGAPPPEVAESDRQIAALDLGVKPEDVVITSADALFQQ